MNKKSLLCLLMLQTVCFSAFGMFGDYNQRAREEVARERAEEHRARIRAKEDELIKRDAEAIGALIVGLGYCIVGSARVLSHPERVERGWKDNDPQIIAGTLTLGTLVVVGAACIVNACANR